MARRGKFGQAPRAVPSLTSTIVSIAREMQSQRDQNLMDAWKNGGEFEGQKATDDMVLAHWRERLAKVSKSDPLYDTYKNTVDQYEYAIAESKASTEYAQGKRSDSAMAKFYLDWAKKVPQDSEFYRVLQRDAAQFMRSAKAKGAAYTKQAQEKAYADAQSATEAKYEKAGQYLTDVLRNMAKSNALIGGGQNQDFSNFYPSDPGQMIALMNTINGQADGRGGKDTSSTTNVLYHDPLTGKPITAGEVLTNLKSYDPNFTGAVSQSYLSSAISRQLEGQQIRLDKAKTTGHKQDANNLEKWQQYTSEVGREANAWPIEQSYINIRNQFLNTWSDPMASPAEKLSAWETYSGGLSKLSNSANIDDSTRARLISEIQGNGNVSSLAEDFTGLGSVDHTTTGGASKGDIAETHFDLQRFDAQVRAVNAGQAVWTQGRTVNGQFVPGPGTEIGASTQQPPQDAIRVFLPQGKGMDAIPVYVTGRPVTVNVVDPDGFSVNSTTPNQKIVATAFDTVVSGTIVRSYKYTRDGVTLYTSDLPGANSPNASLSEGADGITLTLTLDAVPDAKTLSGNPNFSVAYDRSGDPIITVNPAGLALSADQARLHAGIDPNTDSVDPTVSMLSQSLSGRAELEGIAQRDDFKVQSNWETRVAAGQQYDQATKTWSGGDPTKLGILQNTMVLTTTPGAVSSILDQVGRAMSAFGKSQTFAPNSSGGPDDRALSNSNQSQIGQMPADQIKPANPHFGALAGVFNPGTLLLQKKEDYAAFQIKLGKGLTVPAAPAGKGGGGPTVAPVVPVVPVAPTVIAPPISPYEASKQLVTTTTPKYGGLPPDERTSTTTAPPHYSTSWGGV